MDLSFRSPFSSFIFFKENFVPVLSFLNIPLGNSIESVQSKSSRGGKA